MANEIIDNDKDTMNDYIDSNIQSEYFSKITPDSSVLDMVEKYIVDGNDITEKPLIYHVKGTIPADTNKKIELETSFYRLLLKINMNENNKISFNCPFNKLYENVNVFSLISTTDETIKIAFDTSDIDYDYEIIGVGF